MRYPRQLRSFIAEILFYWCEYATVKRLSFIKGIRRQIDDLNLVPERYKHKVFGIVSGGAVSDEDILLPVVWGLSFRNKDFF